MSPEELKIRARRLIEEVLNQGDLAVANELMSPTCVHHVPGSELGPGPASLRDWLSRTLRIFPDFHAIVEDEFAAGDRAALRITAYGTHAATGRPVEFSVLHIVQAGPTAASPSTGARPICSPCSANSVTRSRRCGR